MKIDLNDKPEMVSQIRETFRAAIAPSVDIGEKTKGATELIADLYTDAFLEEMSVSRPAIDWKARAAAHHRM